MAKNKKKQTRIMQYLVENAGKQYGAYMNYETALAIAKSLKGYTVIRRGDEKVWES